MASYDYDMAIIGSGPGGHGAAIQAAKLGKRVAVIERLSDIGGETVNVGTPSKTVREAVVYLTGYKERNIYGESYAVKQNITMSDLMVRTRYVMQHQADMLRNQLIRNRVDMITAEASFTDHHTLNLSSDNGRSNRTLTAEKVMVAVGTLSTVPSVVYADGKLIFVGDDVLNLPDLPRTLTIVGAGPIGLEYCSTFAELGIRVTVVNMSSQVLPFADDEIVDTLIYHLRQRSVTFRLQEEVFDVEYIRDELGDRVRVKLVSGKQIVSDAVMYCVGRTGSTDTLKLEAVGLEADARGRLSVDDNYQTSVEGIYAVGGVIGFPNLVSTSEMQGRLAACHAFGAATNSFPGLFPYAIKTIPEVAMVGKTEAELTENGVPYEVGKARYQESVKSMIQGDDTGLLKLLFDINTRKLLGVHIIGEAAAELIHIGQAVIAHGGTIDYFLEAVTSHPTLAECYPAAALDGISRLPGTNVSGATRARMADGSGNA